MPEKSKSVIITALALDTGYTSLPNIYFGKQHIGGVDDLKSHLQNPNQVMKLKNELQTSDTDSDAQVYREYASSNRLWAQKYVSNQKYVPYQKCNSIWNITGPSDPNLWRKFAPYFNSVNYKLLKFSDQKNQVGSCVKEHKLQDISICILLTILYEI